MSDVRELQKNVVLFASGALVAAGLFGTVGALAQQFGVSDGFDGLFDALRVTVSQVTFWAFLLGVGVTLASWVPDRRHRMLLMAAGFAPSFALTVVVAASLIAHLFRWGDGFMATASFFGSGVAAFVLAGWATGWSGAALLRDLGIRVVRDPRPNPPPDAPEAPQEPSETPNAQTLEG